MMRLDDRVHLEYIEVLLSISEFDGSNVIEVLQSRPPRIVLHPESAILSSCLAPALTIDSHCIKRRLQLHLVKNLEKELPEVFPSAKVV
jgi:hypothetical protein